MEKNVSVQNGTEQILQKLFQVLSGGRSGAVHWIEIHQI